MAKSLITMKQDLAKDIEMSGLKKTNSGASTGMYAPKNPVKTTLTSGADIFKKSSSGNDPVITQMSNSSENTNTGGNTGVSDSYVDLINQMYQQQQAQAQANRQAQMQAAQNAYDKNMAALNTAYQNRDNLLNKNYNSTLEQLAGTYNNSKDSLNQNAEAALREAYVNRMMNERNLGQQLAASGLSGGASETTRASMLNAYGNNRNAIRQDLGNNLSELEYLYNQNRESAKQAYNDALINAASERAAYEMQLNDALANQQATSYANLYSGLANLDNSYLSSIGDILQSQQAYKQQLELAQEQAKASKDLAKYKYDLEAQANAQGTGNTDWRVGYTKDAVSRGLSAAGVAQYLKNSGATEEEIAKILTLAGV